MTTESPYANPEQENIAAYLKGGRRWKDLCDFSRRCLVGMLESGYLPADFSAIGGQELAEAVEAERKRLEAERASRSATVGRAQ